MGKPELAIVSGGGSGIGREVALQLARRGAVVGVLDRNAKGACDTVARIASAGGQARELIADVSLSAEVEAAVADFAGRGDGIDTVVAAAGIARGGLVHRMSEDAWDQVLNVNLKGTFLLARAVIPLLQKRGGGAFVAISSDAGIMGAVAYGAYCASKHGVIGLIRAMALDYGPEAIRCNVVCPGFVDTPMADRIFSRAPEGTAAAYEQLVPMGRFARPEEVAHVVAHLSSPEASYTNGCIYLVDGGSSAGHNIGHS